jgi:hypothetical protein
MDTGIAHTSRDRHGLVDGIGAVVLVRFAWPLLVAGLIGG